MKVFQRVNTIHQTDGSILDVDTNAPFMAGLEDCSCLPDMKVMGALLNPLYQNERRMIAAGLITSDQYKAGKEELIDRMTRFHSMGGDSVALVIGETSGNEWDMKCGDFLDGIPAPWLKAEQEYDAYLGYMHGGFLPTMTAKRCLGFTDEEGNPKDPVYAIGEVITAGKNLPSKCNHSQYINKSGHYDIGWYLLDHNVHFPAIYHVGVGQFCPHISTEVDCEYLFCQSWLPC